MSEQPLAERRAPISGRLILGLAVIALGVIFMLDRAGALSAADILKWWPLALIGYGIMRLTGFGYRPHVVTGALFTGIGTWILLSNFGLISVDPWDLWPIFLILIGVAVVARSMSGARRRLADPGSSPSLQAFALMSGTERRIVNQEFRGGDVTAIMGGHVIDLRSAKLAEGGAVIDLLVWWGGVELRVPADWVVSCEALPIMGGIEDGTKPPLGPIQGRLVLKGLVVMGGVEVKN